MKADDVAYPILQVPDLDLQEKFLVHFGLHRVERTENALFMRGEGPQPFVHETRLGPKKFLGAAYVAQNEADLERLSRTESFGSIEEIAGPGGGIKVAGLDPDGIGVEVVFGRESRSIEDDMAPMGMNVGGVGPETFQRLNVRKRFQKGAYPKIKRFGHYAIHSTDLQASLDWYNAHLGIIPSDLVKQPPADEDSPLVFIFARLDRDDRPSDHHSILFASTSTSQGLPGLNHVSFETINIDDVFMGHEILTKHGYELEWGIGRHYLGSQIFDYWRSPFAQVHEHQTDGDVFDNTVPPQIVNPDDLGNPEESERGSSQWGPPLNYESFGDIRGL
ncbi:MAG: VOC family protein [Pseudomonadota bacterium]